MPTAGVFCCFSSAQACPQSFVALYYTHTASPPHRTTQETGDNLQFTYCQEMLRYCQINVGRLNAARTPQKYHTWRCLAWGMK